MPSRVDTFCFLLTFMSSGSLPIALPLMLFTVSRLTHSAAKYSFYQRNYSGNQEWQWSSYNQNQGQNNGQYNGQYGVSGQYPSYDNSMYQKYYNNARYGNQQYYTGGQNGYYNENNGANNQQTYAYSYSEGDQTGYGYNRGQSGNYQQARYGGNQQYGYENTGSYQNQEQANEEKSESYGKRSCGFFGCIAGFNDRVKEQYASGRDPNVAPMWWFWGQQGAEVNEALNVGLVFIYCCCVPLFIGILMFGLAVARINSIDGLNSMIPVLFVSAGFTTILTVMVSAIEGAVLSDGYAVAENGWYGQIGVLVFLTTALWTIFAIAYGFVLRCKAFSYDEESIEDYVIYHENPAGGLVRRKCVDPDVKIKKPADITKIGRAISMPNKVLPKSKRLLNEVPRPAATAAVKGVECDTIL